MHNQIGFGMVAEDRTAFVKSQGHGILCLADDNRGYGVPVSYGYDEKNDRFVLEIVNTESSKKQAFIDASDEVTLTIYDYQDPDAWESVIARGTLHPLAEGDISDRLAALFFSQAADAVKELRWTEFEGFDRNWYELRVTEMTGRHGGNPPQH